MTIARRHWKSGYGLFAVRLVLALAMVAPIAALAQVGVTERVVADFRTGIAIYGYDPVAYFTDAKPVAGRAVLEYVHAGVTWRFDNDGNRAAFVGHPDVYMPRYGGYDPLGVARGVASPGHPLLWAVSGKRLYLFHSAEDRAAFVKNPKPIIAAADAKWPAVMRGLVP